MTRTVIVGAAIVFAARTGSAQNPLANAKTAAQRAASATSAHVEAEQRPEAQSQATTRVPATAPRLVASAAKPAATRPAAPAPKQDVAGQTLNVVQSDTSGPPTAIMRETFDYAGVGRRDPFFSLLSTNELRPAMSDLRLTGILFDHSGGHSVATLRDVGSNAQYRVTVGSSLGRMRVTSIRVKTVVFTIDEFGSTRQDSLVLGDTTKVRGK